MEHPESPNKSFFEKYQTFFALIICGVLIGGGLVIAKAMPSQGGSLATNETPTDESVRADMISAAKKVGLNKNQFATCIDNGTHAQKVADAVRLAEASGVSGTPTFFILKRSFNPDGSVTATQQFTVLGARDEDTFLQAITDGKAPADQPAIPAGQNITLSETDHWYGPKNAEVVIVEYSDIDCPFCKRAKPTIDKILRDHPEYAFVYRHSPIASLHPFAAYKAAASECAAQLGGQEAFWKFIDIVAK